jgi:two-component system, OmpR family, response regulator MprA
MSHKILIVDDEPAIRRFLKASLESEGFQIVAAETAAQALAAVAQAKPDLMILDLGLPDLDGLDVIRQVRSNNPLPIVVLSVRNDEPGKVAALDAGADDYMVKPFDVDELLARVRALLRRTRSGEGEVYRHADLTIDPATREVRRGDRTIELTAREYDLLEFMTRHARQVFSRETIFERVWGSDFMGESNVIDVVVMRLREKLEADGEPRLIQTVRGVGYTLREAS